MRPASAVCCGCFGKGEKKNFKKFEGWMLCFDVVVEEELVMVLLGALVLCKVEVEDDKCVVVRVGEEEVMVEVTVVDM